MTITWTDVQTMAPELATFDVTGQGFILDFVNSTINVRVLDGEDGPRTRLVRIYLAAHIATVITSANKGRSGVVVAESLGPQSRAYAQLTGVLQDRMETTQYGQLYLHLINTSAGARGPFVV